MSERLWVVVGPTASGKSELALRLAERVNGELIGADSVQVYRGLQIGSGAPTVEERALVPHHLVQSHDPLELLDAGRWAELADAVVRDVRARGRTPIVVGGSFLWVRALVLGLAPTPPADPALRERHKLLAAEQGRAALHAQLAAVDAEAAQRLAPNDLIRVSRALEVFELTGRPQSEWHRAHGFTERRHDARLIGVTRTRDELDARIRQRVEGMLASGWLDEVRGLLRDGYAEARALGSVGYREVCAHLRGELPEPELLETIVRATRVFARRQRTWLRDEPVEWCEPGTLPDPH